jgi:hypothetical protein
MPEPGTPPPPNAPLPSPQPPAPANKKDGRARFITADALAAYVVRLESEAAEVV